MCFGKNLPNAHVNNGKKKFQSNESVLLMKRNVKKCVLEKVSCQVEDFHFHDCHGLKRKFIAKYINTRLYFCGKKQNRLYNVEGKEGFKEIFRNGK